jgi:hypothetical protein
MEAAGSTETLTSTYYTTLHHTPENRFHVHCSVNFTSHIFKLTHRYYFVVYFLKYKLQCVQVGRYLSNYVQCIFDGNCWNYPLQMKELFHLHKILSQHTTNYHSVSLYGTTFIM